MVERISTYNTRVFRIKRDEYKAQRYGIHQYRIWIRPVVDWEWNPSTHRDTIIWRAEEAQLFYFRDSIFELPDDSEGEYVILEHESTNAYGYLPGQLPSWRELVRVSDLPRELAHAGKQIINQLARVSVENDVAFITVDERNLNRKEG